MFARSIKNEFCYDVRLYSGVSYSFSIHTNRWIFIARERFRCRRSRCFHITLFSIINHRKIAVGRVLGQHWRLDTSMADTDTTPKVFLQCFAHAGEKNTDRNIY